MTRRDPDAWLDAFDPAEIDGPELDAFDRSVQRLTRRVRPRRPRRRVWMLVAIAAGLSLLVGIGFGRRSAPPTVVIETPPPVEPTPRALEPVAEPAVESVAEASRPDPPRRRLQPGLLPYEGATLRLKDGTAVLGRGVLRYLHDRGHEPGVDRVRWGTLPVVATPVGTDFTVAAAEELGAIGVQAGTVRLEHADGTLLALLSRGDEIAIVADPEAPLQLRLIDTEGRALDEIAATADPERRAALVAVVASLRLAVHPDALPLDLPD